MAVQTITYDDKSYLNQNSSIPDTNKVNDTDMNMIKSVVNNNANELDNINIGLNYSTSEVNTGEKWIDGSKVYRKVLDIGQYTWQSGSNPFNHGITDLDVIIEIKYLIKMSINDRWYANWKEINENNWTYDSTVISIVSSSVAIAKNLYFILKYTKTS